MTHENTPLHQTYRVISGVLGVFGIVIFHGRSVGMVLFTLIIHYLRASAYVQQLDMETMAKVDTTKRYDRDYGTGTFIWGGVRALTVNISFSSVNSPK